MDLAMQLVFTPMIWRLMERRRKALATEEGTPLPRPAAREAVLES